MTSTMPTSSPISGSQMVTRSILPMLSRASWAWLRWVCLVEGQVELQDHGLVLPGAVPQRGQVLLAALDDHAGLRLDPDRAGVGVVDRRLHARRALPHQRAGHLLGLDLGGRDLRDELVRRQALHGLLGDVPRRHGLLRVGVPELVVLLLRCRTGTCTTARCAGSAPSRPPRRSSSPPRPCAGRWRPGRRWPGRTVPSPVDSTTETSQTAVSLSLAATSPLSVRTATRSPERTCSVAGSR